MPEWREIERAPMGMRSIDYSLEVSTGISYLSTSEKLCRGNHLAAISDASSARMLHGDIIGGDRGASTLPKSMPIR